MATVWTALVAWFEAAALVTCLPLRAGVTGVAWVVGAPLVARLQAATFIADLTLRAYEIGTRAWCPATGMCRSRLSQVVDQQSLEECVPHFPHIQRLDDGRSDEDGIAR